jgi:plastocyanin
VRTHRGVAAVATIAVSSALAMPAMARPATIVEITPRGIQPDLVEVSVGADVEWRQLSDGTFSVLADDVSFDSGELAEGESFTFTFEDPGTFSYRAVPDAGREITAAVVVSGDPPEEAWPSGDKALAPGGEQPGQGIDGRTEDPPAEGDPEGSVLPGTSEGSPKSVPSSTAGGSRLAEVAAAVSFQRVTVFGQASATVTVVDNAYNPHEVNVEQGATVTWNQTGELPHTVTADDGSFDSGEMGPGDSFSHDFSQPGTIAYYCTFHGAPGGVGMSGTVVVSSGGGNGGPSGGPAGGDAGADQGAPESGGLAETGASMGPVSLSMVVLLLLGSACLMVDRRRRLRVEPVTGFERAALLPSLPS